MSAQVHVDYALMYSGDAGGGRPTVRAAGG